MIGFHNRPSGYMHIQKNTHTFTERLTHIITIVQSQIQREKNKSKQNSNRTSLEYVLLYRIV